MHAAASTLLSQVEGAHRGFHARSSRMGCVPMRNHANDPSAGNGEVFTEMSFTRDELARALRAAGDEPTFERCDFEGEDLSNLDFRAARFAQCHIGQTRFEHSDLSRTRWVGCKGASASFRYSNAGDARFIRSDLNNTDWTGAKLGSTLFTEVKLTGARFIDTRALGLSFHESLLVGATLRGLSFRKQTLEKLNFSDADLADCDFRDAVFDGGSLGNVRLLNTRFDGADLRQVDLSGLRLSDVQQHLKGTILSVDQAVMLIGDCGVRVM
ncbi:pentapeptide repeat-containing protein [Paraburkholderia sp. J94]|uniref:pentapeptide repeat-containing protein n=1 Tax=Paraburkholderia sp. J94 TaxID=2805441 RepID=UPI002AAFFF64|nr:pentapeptide repeat-containing protein [Paraburkholderia sp. J94]